MKTSKKTLLTIIIAMAFFILMSAGIAYAYELHTNGIDNPGGNYSFTLDMDKLKDRYNTSSRTVIGMHGRQWAVIGYNGEGVASREGTVTLLYESDSGDLPTTAFSKKLREGGTNQYARSLVKATIEKYAADTFTELELAAIVPRTLAAGTYEGENTDCVAGEEVKDALLWPLSTKEAFATDSLIREDFRRRSWLRSPGMQDGYTDYYAAYMDDNGAVFKEGIAADFNTGDSFTIRPAMMVDLDDILFISNGTAKESSSPGPDSLVITDYYQLNQKMTLKDDSRKSFKIESVHNTDIRHTKIKYSGAKTGKNEYISAVVITPDGIISHYGKLAKASSQGTVSVNLLGKFNEGDRLYLFNEQCNGDLMTDYSSEFIEVPSDISGMMMGSDAFRMNANTEFAQTIVYGGNTYRPIGYDGKGVLSEKGTITWFADPIRRCTFNDSNSNEYFSSNLRAQVDDIAGRLTDAERSVIIPRDLVSGDYNGENTDCVAGREVKNALLWPLSTKEAAAAHDGILTDRNTNTKCPYMWLRSPGDPEYDNDYYGDNGIHEAAVAYVWGYWTRPYYWGVPPKIDHVGCDVAYSYMVRPAFIMDLDAVLFSSAVNDGKSCGDTGKDALMKVKGHSAANDEYWKLTLRDADHSGFNVDAAEQTGDCSGSSVNIQYSGAKTGTNEYISAVIKDRGGNITYYGRIKELSAESDASGTVAIDLTGKFEADDTLYLYNEQFNGDETSGSAAKTDLASDLIAIAVTCPEHDWNSGQATKKATLSEDGVFTYTCTKCGETYTEAIPRINECKLVKDSFTYSGKAAEPEVEVMDADDRELVKGTDYIVSYKNNTNAGTATASVEFTGAYEGTVDLGFAIGEAANPLAVKGKTVTVKYKALKKKASTLAAGKVITFTKKGMGTMTYSLTGVKKAKFRKYFKVDSKTGKVTIRKGLKKGTYKVTVKVKAAGNTNYKASAAKSVTFTVAVK